ncbi:MAG: PP2C family protein-serine/threonine phosphatase [Chloroflexota bacterium]
MNKTLLRIAKVFWPDIASFALARQLVIVGDILTTGYSTLAYLLGFFWLVRESDFSIFRQHWTMLLLLAGIIILFTYLNFFMIIEFREDRYGSSDGSFNSMAVWTAAFIFGPTSLWIMIVLLGIQFFSGWFQDISKAAKLNNLRYFSLSIAGFTLPYLAGLRVFELLGGIYPIQDLGAHNIIAGFAGIIVNFIVLILIWLPYFLFAVYTQKKLTRSEKIQPIVQFFFLSLALPTFAHPFAILAAGLYSENGVSTFIFLVLGLIIVAYLARQFSMTSESNRQQTRQLEKLESLGRAILTAPPDVSILPEILGEHIPNMFPSGNIVVWMIPGQILFKSPQDEWPIEITKIWEWAQGCPNTRAFTALEPIPWEEEHKPHRPVVYSPILAQEGKEIIGGIFMELHQLAQPWSTEALQRLFPALHSLRDQISSAIHQAEEYARSIALEKVSQEIKIAGQIQASFLPNQFPNIPGWQLAVSLEPAGGLSGDFFDLIPLSRGRLGIVIADVADKGLGAALYMALCRTLIRTYALEYQSRPDLVLSEANERILADARANLFITTFYGVLDPTKNTLIYCNAGHNPPILIGTDPESVPVALVRTGMPIGIEEDSSWERRTLQFSPGDKLILYTDGITEAQNNEGELFDDHHLVETVILNRHQPAFDLQVKILEAVKEHAQGAPQYDDITLMILEKEKSEEKNSKKSKK